MLLLSMLVSSIGASEPEATVVAVTVAVAILMMNVLPLLLLSLVQTLPYDMEVSSWFWTQDTNSRVLSSDSCSLKKSSGVQNGTWPTPRKGFSLKREGHESRYI